MFTVFSFVMLAINIQNGDFKKVDKKGNKKPNYVTYVLDGIMFILGGVIDVILLS